MLTKEAKEGCLEEEAKLPLRDFLLKLEAGQKIAQNGEISSGVLVTRKHILNGFKQTSAFRQRYCDAINFHLLPRTDQEMSDFRNQFAGAIFQGAALFYLAAQTLITDENLLKVYQQLHPGARVIKHPLGQTSLAGISVPDGLLLENGIKAVCEATLSEEPNTYHRHYIGFKKDKQVFPEIFANSKLIFISPQKANLPYDIKQDKKVELIELPFNRGQFRDYIDELYKFYRPDLDDSSLTLLELQKWAHGQFKRMQAYKTGSWEKSEEESGNGYYSREYKAYFRKVSAGNLGSH